MASEPTLLQRLLRGRTDPAEEAQVLALASFSSTEGCRREPTRLAWLLNVEFIMAGDRTR